MFIALFVGKDRLVLEYQNNNWWPQIYCTEINI